MKKLLSGVICILLIFGLCSCSSGKNKNDLKTGTYVNSGSSDIDSFNYVKLQDGNRFYFSYSVLSSYISAGSYEIKDDKLILTGDSRSDISETFVFEIDNDKLIFLQDESTKLPDYALKDIYDGAVFEFSPPATEEK